MIYFTRGVNPRVKPKGRAAPLPLGNPIALWESIPYTPLRGKEIRTQALALISFPLRGKARKGG